MLSNEMRNMLVCPHCHGVLNEYPNELTCKKCVHDYPIVEGIIMFAKTSLIPYNIPFKDGNIDANKEYQTSKEGNRKKKTLRKAYWKLQEMMVPALQSSQTNYENVLASRVRQEYVWLDLGCGHHILPEWRLEEERKLVQKCKAIIGMDFTMESLLKHKTIENRIQGNISRLPFVDNAFDVITSNMVVEHLELPCEQFKEIARVLRPGGVFIFHTPNARGYRAMMAKVLPEKMKKWLIRLLEAREEHDVFDTYYLVNTEKAITEIASKAGLQVVELKYLLSVAELRRVLPLAVIELLWIKMLKRKALAHIRPFIVSVLMKPHK